VSERVPTKLVIADAAWRCAADDPRREPPLSSCTPAGCWNRCWGFSRRLWRESLPLRLDPAAALTEDGLPGPDATDLEVLSLLLAGMTDASVAKQLDSGCDRAAPGQGPDGTERGDDPASAGLARVRKAGWHATCGN